jgi:acetyltransferase-like isoleucine patch superfamily enzyme
MNPLLKIIHKALQIPTSLINYFDLQLKKEGCTLASGACLHQEARILNFRQAASAISVGEGSHVRGDLVVFGYGGIIRIGTSCFVGEGSRIWSAELISIGDRVLISHGVNIHDNNSHSLSATDRQRHFKQIVSTGHPAVVNDIASAPIVIEDDAWIGFNSTILKGVTVGRGAVVGATSVVTKDVPAYTIVAGNPARCIGHARP